MPHSPLCLLMPLTCALSLTVPSLHALRQVPSTALIAAAPAGALVGVWVGFQDSSWAWVLQDLLGAALMALILRQFRLPNLKARLVPVPAQNGHAPVTVCWA